MNLDKIALWVMGIIITAATIGQLDRLQNWILKEQTNIIYESRTSTWGSPRFFPESSKKVSGENSKSHTR